MTSETTPHNHTGDDCEYCGKIQIKIWEFITMCIRDNEVAAINQTAQEQCTASDDEA